MLGLQVPDDGHVLVEAASRDDLLPLRDRAPVLLLDGREVRRRSFLRPGRRLLGHVAVLLSLSPTEMTPAGASTELIVVHPAPSTRAAIPPPSCWPSFARQLSCRSLTLLLASRFHMIIDGSRDRQVSTRLSSRQIIAARSLSRLIGALSPAPSTTGSGFGMAELVKVQLRCADRRSCELPG